MRMLESDEVAWVKVDDAFYDHPKFLCLPHDALALWIVALAWCNRNRTDGHVPRAALARLGFDTAQADALVHCGQWTVDGDAGWLVHDYIEYQATRDFIESKQQRLHASRSEAGRKGAAQRWQSGKVMATPRQADAPNPKPNTNNPEVQEHCSTPMASNGVQVSTVALASFEQWWQVYPRRQGKGLALKSYAKALRSCSADMLLAAAERYRDDPNREAQFTCMPATWLNQERWNDEALPSRGAPLSAGSKMIMRAAAMARANTNGAHDGSGADDRGTPGQTLGALPRGS